MTDELKPVRCGCGGEAFVSINGFIEYHVVCALCGMRTDWFRSKDKAIEAWNRAMGAGKDDIAITKGTWMRTLDGFHCSVCFYKCETTALPDVCPHCGADMRGEYE